MSGESDTKIKLFTFYHDKVIFKITYTTNTWLKVKPIMFLYRTHE